MTSQIGSNNPNFLGFQTDKRAEGACENTVSMIEHLELDKERVVFMLQYAAIITFVCFEKEVTVPKCNVVDCHCFSALRLIIFLALGE